MDALTGRFSKSLAKELQAHAHAMRDTPLQALFAADNARFARLHRRAGPILLDLSKQHLSAETLALLYRLADQAHLSDWIARLFQGESVNQTEDRPAMHWALRVVPSSATATMSLAPQVNEQLTRMDKLVSKLHAGQWRGVTGEPITDVVNIGVGGSDLGPLMATRALEDSACQDVHPLRLHFVSTMDGSQVSHLLNRLRPQTTLFVISSKSFTTVDTLSNAATARAWLMRTLGDQPAVLAQHFLGVSAQAERMSAWGIRPANQLHLWDWVGGRFSLWSAIGLPIALKTGMTGFRQMLAGAAFMDDHFHSAEWQENLPVLLALTGIWNTNFLGIHAHAILPYDGRLKYLPSYLEQLEMESNGKSVDRDEQLVDYQTCPIIWGEIGPNAQHAFYQLLHQGTPRVTCDFIAAARRYHDQVHTRAAADLVSQHQLALANCLAQSRLLALGSAALPPGEASVPAHRHYRGNQPSSTILLDELEPFGFGALIAMYEHKVFTQSVIWNINPFDQWGVEMGKRIATDTLSMIVGDTSCGEGRQPMDASTAGLVEIIKTYYAD